MKFIYLTCTSLLLFTQWLPKGNAAEKVNFVKGMFSRSITIKELEHFTKTGIRKGILSKVIKKKEKEKAINVLTREYKAPIVLTSKLLNSKIGNAILLRVAKVVNPYTIPDESISILAIRSATIKALDLGDEKISLLRFLKAYPSDVLTINVTELYKVLNKVETMSALMKFYADSPLEKLKN